MLLTLDKQYLDTHHTLAVRSKFAHYCYFSNNVDVNLKAFSVAAGCYANSDI